MFLKFNCGGSNPCGVSVWINNYHIIADIQTVYFSHIYLQLQYTIIKSHFSPTKI